MMVIAAAMSLGNGLRDCGSLSACGCVAGLLRIPITAACRDKKRRGDGGDPNAFLLPASTWFPSGYFRVGEKVGTKIGCGHFHIFRGSRGRFGFASEIVRLSATCASRLSVSATGQIGNRKLRHGLLGNRLCGSGGVARERLKPDGIFTASSCKEAAGFCVIGARFSGSNVFVPGGGSSLA